MSPMYRILLGYVLITLVVLASERSRALAGILATAPINIPIILWIIAGRGNSNHAELVIVTRSMLTGIVSTAVFIVVCWYGFGRRWSLPHTFALGYLTWAVVVWGPPLVQRVVARWL